MRTIDLYRRWRDACALVDELKAAAEGPGNLEAYAAPPLYDGDIDTSKAPDWKEISLATERANRRLKRAEDIRDAARTSLLSSLDEGEG